MAAPINPKAALYFGGRRGGRLTEVEMSLTSLVDRADVLIHGRGVRACPPRATPGARYKKP